ncbi:cell division protein FtsI/penicillin-binding protein 2 [Solirubrobacter pauli]|uniref:Cell division protein FtsI/penicillin-binding protein 2 n=1 Tax=Solirubrobacter pauli TaxID=166793 RepID=A0A660LGS8_9ACTN|nr:penicillin-binding transpeptidase domain-containing protein [Solirubrobacter pauli]RKQ93879.1 cell division protein FtsI/penicillin-binding protein 2 [Solirubrobacter pauli]
MARRHVIASPKRFAPLAASAAVALLGGMVVGARHVPPEKRTVEAFAAAYERGDQRAMYALLSDEARRRTSLERMQRTYKQAAETLTLEQVRVGRVEQADRVPVALETRIFGTLRGVLVLTTGERKDQDPGIDWTSELVYPGLHRGEKLKRETTLPERASILARDGTPLAKGPDRLSDLGPLASEIAGRIGPAPEERRAELAKRGVPDGAPVGLTGLERQFDARLSGTPGGVLYAGGRVLARKEAVRGADVKATIDPKIQRGAVEALAGRYGGIAVIAPKTGEVLALAGIATSAPQPPGSTFKIVTLAGVLQNKVAKRTDSYEVTDRTTIEGVDIQNANGEYCGGSLRTSFAHSCNSVFAPLGAKLGAEKLVATAEAFGFNQDPSVAGAARSTIPPADEIGDDLAVGSTAIGQGKVLATPLQMAVVGATVAADGVKATPTLLRGDDPRTTRVMSKSVASTIKSYMRTVVTDGTGGAAALPNVKVSGKTGTAELRTTVKEEPPPEVTDPDAVTPPEDDTTDTDAWFVAFAPYNDPEVAVAALFVAQGTGGDTAAPAARVVLDAAF